MQGQIDELFRRLDTADAERGVLIERAAAADERAELDRQMILDLQAAGVVTGRHTHDLEEALKSSRTIGAAMGILMESRKLSADQAFAALRQASQDSNRKLRELAAEMVEAASPSDTEPEPA